MRLSRSALLDRLLAPAPDAARVAWLRGVAYAHRGLHGSGAVENSPTAFARAVAAGLGIECDVQETADGEAAVFHDLTLERLTGEAGAVADRTLADLRQVALAGSADTIPALRDLLALVGGRTPLLVEIKARADRSVAALCRTVQRAFEGYAGDHAVMSFDPRVGRWFAHHAPETVRGLVVAEADSPGWRGRWRRRRAVWHARPDFLACDVRDLPSRFAACHRARGLPVLTWTVSDAALLTRAREHADAPIAEGEGLASALASP
jgi:glycerophosphoryl diester phosphodiesterase